LPTRFFLIFPSTLTARLYLPFNMPGRLEGKIALVSGSTQGFGRGILETFVREGAVVLGLDLQATDGPVDGFTEAQAYQIKANVVEEASWKKAVSDAIAASPCTMYL
jgi:NAD(P)-dependent dehydrogenase (short-subunit alcohol dehydrogenase family)